ncbi:hypothetical protein B0H10DRAFT_1985464 [Mycena sp. CBHHK59/15]|nr:hypothetical protein B0H10DRAFT_1985464 [Mycena sp. CBHHK59/15]
MLTQRFLLLHVKLPSALLFSAHPHRQLSQTATAIKLLKNPSRSGQNLSLRYQRLEKSVRGEAAL